MKENNKIIIFNNFFFWFSVYSFIPVIPIALSGYYSPSQIGLIIGSYSIGSLLFRVASGHISNLIGVEKLMVIGILISTLSLLGYFLYTNYYLFLLVRFIHGIGGALFTSSAVSMITLFNDKGKIREIISHYTLSSMLGIGIITSTAYITYRYTSFGFVIGLSIFASLLCTLSLLKLKRVDCVKASSKRKEFIGPDVIWPIASQFFTYLNYIVISTFVPLYLIGNVADANVTLFFISYTLFVVLTRLFIKSISNLIKENWLENVVYSMIIVSVIIISLNSSNISLVFSGVCLGLGVGLATPTFATIISNNTSTENRSVAMGYFSASIDLAMSIGPVIFGYLVKYITYQHLLFSLLMLNVLYVTCNKVKKYKGLNYE